MKQEMAAILTSQDVLLDTFSFTDVTYFTIMQYDTGVAMKKMSRGDCLTTYNPKIILNIEKSDTFKSPSWF